MLMLEVRGQSKHQLEVDENARIAGIKNTIAQLENVPATEILLYSSGAPLVNDMLISQLPSLTIDFTIPLLGGKVHGSLARAGKVKGQTPKVEKQDKKKKKTGRAKRRMQYNRRFVNVVQTFGRRRGPNSNS
uniref:Ubiquitin/ribosomal protein S30e fusion protein-like protein n=1 Tax=Maconellicoccus hirsutus TaxID=177089 RepID=A2I3X4_MACHI|nr:ubiquitin/ribosomal protein S30e fusion protein-like protein [Maconellicoccus hirsutus]